MKSEEIKNELVKRGFLQFIPNGHTIQTTIKQFTFIVTFIDAENTYYFAVLGEDKSQMYLCWELPLERIEALVFGLTGTKI